MVGYEISQFAGSIRFAIASNTHESVTAVYRVR